MYKKLSILILPIYLLFGSTKINVGNTGNYTIDNSNKEFLLIEVSIDYINSETININNEEYSLITLENSYPSTKIGEPQLPYLNKLIEIPHNASLRIEIINDEIQEFDLSNYNIYNQIVPVQSSISKSSDLQDITFIKDLDIYQNNTFYKNPLIDIEIKGFIRQVQIGNIMVSPIEYNPLENKIILHQNIKFKLHFDNADFDLTNIKKNEDFSPYFEQIYQSSLNNYSSPTPLIRNNDFLNNNVSYVIVADPIFNEELTDFITWKTMKGYDIIVGYTNEIGSSSASIEAFIQEQYNNPPDGMPTPTFVLLVGDTQQVPASYSSGGHVSDLDYCDFTNDNLPDVLCGRFSAQNPTHLAAQINKTLEYEQFIMPDPSFLANVIMVSGVDANYAPTYGNGQINYGNNYYFNSANDINSYTYLYPASSNAELQILNLADDGASFMNYTAHGWESGWADPEFNTTDADNMTNNHKYPTMVGNCCLTNAFDSGVCFGEALLRKSNAGAIGYIGGSDVTYWDEDYWWGVGAGGISSNPSYNNTGTGIYDGIFHENDESNWATVNAAIIMLGNLAVVEANGMDDYYFEIYHLMGDPSISTYFGIPESNDVSFNPFLPVGSEAIEIQANVNSYVGLSQNGNLISSGTVDNSGYIVLVFNPISESGTLDLVITAQNTEPYFDEIFVASPDGAYVTVNDYTINSGNDNIISLDEVINIDITLENVGSEASSNIDVSLNNINNNPYIELINNSMHIESLDDGEESTINLSFNISNEAPYGHNFSLGLEMLSNESEWNQTLNLNVENLVESFESQTFDNFLWEFSGDATWGIENNLSSNGFFSARSGVIDNNMTSEIFITMDIVEDGYISFDKKISCEDVGSQTGNYYDYLGFYIDGEEQGKWAGDIDWSNSTYAVSQGEHTFLWIYNKDQGVTGGQDAVWIDNLNFPPSYYNSILLGDVNQDSTINIQDVILTVNIILNTFDYNPSADMNEDGNIDVLDVISIVNIILQ